MNINVLVSGAAYSTQSAYTALQFCYKAVAQGHTICQVFFYSDAVTQASNLIVPLGDEFNCIEEWAKFAQMHSTELVVCVSAAERRGILNEMQAGEFSKEASNLHPAFNVEGLGVLHDASLASDRTVTFK